MQRYRCVSVAGVALLEGATLQEILRRLAGLILRAALSPQAIALHRLITAESARFPNLLRAVYDEGWAQQATTLIGDLLSRELRDARLTVNVEALQPRNLSTGLSPCRSVASWVWARP
jgi:hypothetical protein